MEIETVKNAIIRKLDWDNYLICGVGDLSVKASAPNAGSFIDMNGDSHDLNTVGSSFNIAWNIPKKGKLFSVGEASLTHLPHILGNGYAVGYKKAYQVVLGCVKNYAVAGKVQANSGIFKLLDSNGSTVFSWDSPASYRTASEGGEAFSYVPLSYELGVECDVGMTLTTSQKFVMPTSNEPLTATIGGIMFVPYKEE